VKKSKLWPVVVVVIAGTAAWITAATPEYTILAAALY